MRSRPLHQPRRRRRRPRGASPQRDRQAAGRRHRRRRPGTQATGTGRGRLLRASPGTSWATAATTAARRRPSTRSPARSSTTGSASSDARIAPGLFGENLTTTGIDVDAAEQGDTWRVGTRGAAGDRAAGAVRDLRRPDGGAGVGTPLRRARSQRVLPRGGAGRPDRRRATPSHVERSGSGLACRCCSPAGWATSTRPARRWPTTRSTARAATHFTRLLAKRTSGPGPRLVWDDLVGRTADPPTRSSQTTRGRSR